MYAAFFDRSSAIDRCANRSFPVIKKRRTAAPDEASTQEGYHAIQQDFTIGRVSLGILFFGHIILALFPYALPVVAFPGLLGLFGVIFQPAFINVVVFTYKRQGGKEVGRMLGGVAAIESIRYVWWAAPHFIQEIRRADTSIHPARSSRFSSSHTLPHRLRQFFSLLLPLWHCITSSAAFVYRMLTLMVLK